MVCVTSTETIRPRLIDWARKIYVFFSIQLGCLSSYRPFPVEYQATCAHGDSRKETLLTNVCPNVLTAHKIQEEINDGMLER